MRAARRRVKSRARPDALEGRRVTRRRLRRHPPAWTRANRPRAPASGTEATGPPPKPPNRGARTMSTAPVSIGARICALSADPCDERFGPRSPRSATGQPVVGTNPTRRSQTNRRGARALLRREQRRRRRAAPPAARRRTASPRPSARRWSAVCAAPQRARVLRRGPSEAAADRRLAPEAGLAADRDAGRPASSSEAASQRRRLRCGRCAGAGPCGW